MTEAVNDTLKAIAASLLMEQVLAPRFEFRPKTPSSGPQPGLDHGLNGYDEGGCNVGTNSETGAVQIEINGLAEAESDEATRICRENLNEVVASFVQHTRTVQDGLFNEECLKHGKLIKCRCCARVSEAESYDPSKIAPQAIVVAGRLDETVSEVECRIYSLPEVIVSFASVTFNKKIGLLL